MSAAPDSDEHGGVLPETSLSAARRTLFAEIERDVREQRRSGVITPEFEAELDRAFATVAPPGSTGAGFDVVVDQAARHAIVDYDAPIVGSPALRFVKKAVKVLTAWYMIFVGRQFTAFAGTTLRALRIIGGRVDELERRTPATDPRVMAKTVPVSDDFDVSIWTNTIIEAFSKTGTDRGRVLHADCGDGALTVALCAAGINAFGVDPRPDAGAAADAASIEVRCTDVLDQLARTAAGSLRGVVLTHCVDRLALGDQLELIERASVALESNGTLVLVGQHPQVWAGAMGSLGSDLSVGRPLHRATWEALLRDAGLDDIRGYDAAPAVPEEIRNHTDAAIRSLASAVFVSDSSCIVARVGTP